MVSRELTDFGQGIAERVAVELASGRRAVHLQLLASQFYEALKDELARTPRHDGRKLGVLAAAADQCRRAAHWAIAPPLLLVELRAAVAMLSGAPPGGFEAPAPARPQLRVIQGGLA